MNMSELYYDVANKRTIEQDERRRHFDNVAIATLGFSGVVIGLMSLNSVEPGSCSIWPAVAALIIFGGVGISALNVLWPRPWQFQPPLADLMKNMEAETYLESALTLWAGKQMSSAIDNNDRLLDTKAKWLRLSQVLLILEALSVATFVFWAAH